jgi:hypothetical protein
MTVYLHSRGRALSIRYFRTALIPVGAKIVATYGQIVGSQKNRSKLIPLHPSSEPIVRPTGS